MQCAIFYGNGRVFEGEPMDAPAVDVGAIVFEDNSGSRSTGRSIISGWDYYLFRPDRGWLGVNGEVDLIDHVLHDCPAKVLKGRMYDKATWQRLQEAARTHPGFPKRSAVDPGFENGRHERNKAGQTEGF